jgi:FHS family glucose/mannose:H+ symporter-like MFS transporter
MSSIATAQHRTSGRRWPLYGSFAATGVALTLPGALLPMLLRRWSLGDARGGALLGSFFIGCTVGSICVRGRVARSMAAGAALLAFGSLGLVVAGAAAAYAAMTIYGMGLGLAMTSISLLVSQRFPADRRVEMQRLNLLWAVGAVCGPWLALHAARPGRLFVEIAVFFTLFAAWSWWMEDDSRPLHADMAATSQGSGRPPGWKLLRVPLPLLAMIFLATGVESSSAGWLTTYTERSGDSLRATIGTATLLWSGVLLSRGFHATRWASRLPERGVLAISAACISMALAILVASPERTSTMIAAASPPPRPRLSTAARDGAALEGRLRNLRCGRHRIGRHSAGDRGHLQHGALPALRTLRSAHRRRRHDGPGGARFGLDWGCVDTA